MCNGENVDGGMRMSDGVDDWRRKKKNDSSVVAVDAALKVNASGNEISNSNSTDGASRMTGKEVVLNDSFAFVVVVVVEEVIAFVALPLPVAVGIPVALSDEDYDSVVVDVDTLDGQV